MGKHVLAVCDAEETYANRLAEYLLSRKELPFEIKVYTKAAKLLGFLKEEENGVVLVGESIYTPDMREHTKGIIILLSEKEEDKEGYIYKYQSAERITHELLEYCTKEQLVLTAKYKKKEGMKLIGVYSPVKRCLQTSFSLVLGQHLGKKHRVLYMNLESYSGLGKLMEGKFDSDLSDLFYFLKHGREKLFVRIESMMTSMNGMDILPPFTSFFDMMRITAEEWIELIRAVEEQCTYEYIILDLSDSIQGVFEILRMCHSIYTLTRDDGIAQAKIEQYETMLKLAQYTDILEKTINYNFPYFRQLPLCIEQLPYSELGEYVRNILKEELDEKIS